MSFLTSDGHTSTAPGFGQQQDPFAGLIPGRAVEEDDGIDFEDTYDGLGDNLEEANDDFNDDTFGGATESASKPVGKDFDFFGRTSKVSDAITEEHLKFNRQQAPLRSVASIVASAPKSATRPIRTGYEKYREPGHMASLQVDPALWGAPSQVLQPGKQARPELAQSAQSAQHLAPAGKKMLSLEEVEEQMRQQTRKSIPMPMAPAELPQLHQQILPQQGHRVMETARYQPAPVSQHGPHQHASQVELPAPIARAPHILQRPQHAMSPFPDLPQLQARSLQPQQMHHPNQGRTMNYQPGMIPYDTRLTQQLAIQPEHQLSLEDRNAILIEEAKRAKRNHKIFLLSKDNGLMTPQDKNFVTRIQLQQLMAATGNLNDNTPETMLAEDFYYQVHSQIRGGPRQNPHQPLNLFAQTYLFQTGGRQGFNRRNNRGDNHVQRMEQQVQRAVEAAKLKPKNKQLVIAGSLGKISFSNSKTPKPLLNIKRHDSENNRPQSAGRQQKQTEMSSSDRKSVLASIEAVYSTLMKMEDDLRKEPMPGDGSDPTSIEKHMEWRHGMQILNQKLWTELRVPEPINSGSAIPHPFIAILSYPKGKKIIPRVFRHLSTEQRVIMLTMIVLHLDILDVVVRGQLHLGESQLPAAAREAVDLFSAAVTPSLFSYVSEAPLYNIIGLLGLILSRVNVPHVARTRVGLTILTMLTSRATLVKEAGNTDDAEWQQWSQSYNQLFDILEPVLPAMFPGSVSSGEDVYVWQFLAAIGSGASPEQQQRLVLAVKDRVMETVQLSKTLPPEMASQRLGTVNLFMRAIGLDVELLA